MATATPGKPCARSRVDASDIREATREADRLADEVVAFLYRHGLARKEAATVLHIALSKSELFGVGKSQEGVHNG